MALPRINLEYADRFLRLLGKYTDRDFTFQAFDDKRDKRSFLAKMLHGDLNQHARSLASLNADGAGIYVTVNRTDMRGRSLNNMRRVRAFFVDKDNGPFNRDRLLAPPHMIVRTRNGEHAYWLVQDDDADTEEYLSEFPIIQKAMIEFFDGDRNAHDLTRVMRVPGFFHHKEDPYLITLITARESQAPYTAQELISIFGLDLEKHRPKRPSLKPIDRSAFPAHDERVTRCQAYMDRVEGAIEGQGGDRHTYNTCKIGADFGLTDEEFWPILWNWNVQKCQPPWTEWELEKKLHRASDRRTEAFGHRLFEEREPEKPKGLKKRIRVNGPGPDEPFEWEDDPSWLEKLPETISKGERIRPPIPEYDEPPIDVYEAEAAGVYDDVYGENEAEPDPDQTPPPKPPSGSDGDGGGGKRRKRKVQITGTPWHKRGNPDGPWAPIRTRPPAEERGIAEMVRRMKDMFDFMRAPNDQAYVYTGKFWRPIHHNTLRAMCLESDYEPHTTVTRREKVRKTIEDETTLARDVPWNDLKPEEVPFDNGVLNILTGRMRHHRPNDYLDKYIPHDYDPDAQCPRWLACLDDWFGDDEEKKLAMQEFFGYVLMTSSAKYKMCMVLLGESNTGKSQVTNVARELVGMQNICQIPLEQMDDARKRAPIKGKMLNVISELPQWGTLAESGFKMLVSNDEPVEIDAKHVQQETIIPTAKHIIATNSFPHINDRSKGVINRMLVIKFERVIEVEKMDVHLLERLKTEMQGIANWAIEGARRLIESGGQWTKPSGMGKLLKHYTATSNPIQLFIENDGNVVIDPEGTIRTSRFAQLYKDPGTYPKMAFSRIIRTMEELGYVTVTIKGYKYYKGVRERRIADGVEDF